MFLGDQLLIAYDGLHGGANPKSYQVPLEKGFYPVHIEFFQKAREALLNLRYIVHSDETPRLGPVPFERQYSSR